MVCVATYIGGCAGDRSWLVPNEAHVAMPHGDWGRAGMKLNVQFAIGFRGKRKQLRLLDPKENCSWLS